MPDAVTPALTREGWAKCLEYPLVFEKRTIPRHALAALCLHGQPFGFSREDVRLVEFIAEFDPQDHPDVPKLRSLAARISALLPPEEEAP